MGKYIRMFDTEAEYSQASKINPSVDWVVETDRVVYNPYHDYSRHYLTFVVTTGGNIGFSGSTAENTLSFSKDNGETWNTADSATTIPVAEGDKVLWKGTAAPQSYKGIGKFSGDTTARYSVEGNAMSLLFGDDFKNQTSLENKNSAFYSLFGSNSNITGAENMVLPATTLANVCYGYMFEGCTSLTTAPELLATTLANECYNGMFYGCTNLTTAPSVLSATTLLHSCYRGMFQHCTSLTTSPQLLASTLAYASCYNMFDGCSNLNSITCLATDISAGQCTGNWVSSVASSGTFTKAAGMTSWTTGTSGIPSGWTVIDKQ